MRVQRSWLWIALGVVALAAIGIGAWKLVSDHRQAKLEDAFRLLAVGVERLNAGDRARAESSFQTAVEQFGAAKRDPLFALHHVFAARLRVQTSELPEVRELVLTRSREEEKLLALAFSHDSTLLTVATTDRLLCFRTEEAKWSQWPLPKPIAAAAALHVESVTGKAYLVVGDDGRLVTAGCRESSPSAPVVSTSLTANAAAVAWIDPDAFTVWVAPANPKGATVRISARPLPGARGEPLDMRVTFPGEANSLFETDAVIHAIARIGENILLFYGDTLLLDPKDLRDESVLVVAADDPERQMNKLVFPAFTVPTKSGKSRWRSTHVQRVLPASAPGRVYALTKGPQGVAVLGPNAKPIERHAESLFSTEYQDGRETYDLSVKSPAAGAFVEVSRRGADTHLNYQLPWRYEQNAELAAISQEGRQIVVASAKGSLLLVNLAKAPAQ